MSTGVSTFVIRWINLLTLFVAVGVIGFGVWISIHHDGCRKSLTLPVLGLGTLIFVISIVGFLGALRNNSILLWMYLIILFFILLGILVFTVLAFIITNNGTGHNVPGFRFKEYHLQDYNKWFLKELNNTNNWKRLQSCLVKADDCSNLSKRYKTLKQYKSAKLTPIEAGCCRPPSQCGYPAVNASYYDLSFHPISSAKDCRLYRNSKSIKCYNCDSCKAAVAEYMKIEWRVVAIFNVVLFVVLDAKGQEVDLNKYRGKVLLIVNVASQCGFTNSNYPELTTLYQRYKDQGLEILAFPSNQFNGQEPGSNDEIQEFACTRFKAEYPIFSKVDVNGKNAEPLYNFLRSSKGGLLGDNIKWNFTKFLVDKEGKVVDRYAPTTTPLSIEKDIKKLLGVT